MEFTNTRRGFFQRNGSYSLSGFSRMRPVQLPRAAVPSNACPSPENREAMDAA